MKKIKPPHVIAEELLLFFSEKGANTSVGISKMAQIGQTQVYRNLFGTPKRVTKTMKKLCIYANISIYYETSRLDPSSSTILMRALAEIWDGSEEQARRISRFLFALKHVDV